MGHALEGGHCRCGKHRHRSVAGYLQTCATPRAAPVEVTLTTLACRTGVTQWQSGYGYQITRPYFSLEGWPVTADQVTVGSRMVAVLTVAPMTAARGLW